MGFCCFSAQLWHRGTLPCTWFSQARHFTGKSKSKRPCSTPTATPPILFVCFPANKKCRMEKRPLMLRWILPVGIVRRKGEWPFCVHPRPLCFAVTNKILLQKRSFNNRFSRKRSKYGACMIRGAGWVAFPSPPWETKPRNTFSGMGSNSRHKI